mmetsp:Transcript_14820/g.26219  ORF Transcript_14820/g.26219 Transcript_14820/m.26219 type:complete len:212 (-) Transcript_14820:704-1339(-)
MSAICASQRASFFNPSSRFFAFSSALSASMLDCSALQRAARSRLSSSSSCRHCSMCCFTRSSIFSLLPGMESSSTSMAAVLNREYVPTGELAISIPSCVTSARSLALCSSWTRSDSKFLLYSSCRRSVFSSSKRLLNMTISSFSFLASSTTFDPSCADTLLENSPLGSAHGSSCSLVSPPLRCASGVGPSDGERLSDDAISLPGILLFIGF